MKYVVVARDWTVSLAERFGPFGLVHELSNTEIIECIKQFGRASIGETKYNSLVLDVWIPRSAEWYILFENTCD